MAEKLRWVRLRETLSGGRCDGRPWPPGGSLIDIPDWEAEAAVAAGWAYYDEEAEQAEAPEPVKVKNPEPVKVKDPEPVKVKEPELALEVSEAAAPDVPAPDVPEPPRPSDPKQDWVDYAVSQGMDQEKALAMSKADLMSRYGGRL